MENIETFDQDKIKVSVLIPVCNVGKYLSKCIDSVIKQTLQEIEIICINDGSTDNSLKILREYEKKDDRIKIIDKVNSGYGDSMNHGLRAATGEYIGIVESDDFISPTMFEKLYSLSNNGNVDIIKSNFYNYYDDGTEMPNAEPDTDRINIPDSEEPFTLLENGTISWGHPSVWSAIYRREFLIKNNITFIPAKGGGWVDNPFYYETLCTAESIMWTNKPFYYYRKTNPTSSSNLQKDVTLPFVRMIDNFDIIEKYGITDLETIKCAYARALMYYTGALADFDCDANIALLNEYAEKMMEHIDEDILNENFNFYDQHKYYSALSPMSSIMSKGPRVLIYNWVPYDNKWNYGGGVTVYCRNLINEIRKKNPDVTIYFLSSGFAYDASSLKTYIRKIDTNDNVHNYEIVNSPIPAAQDNMFVNPCAAIKNDNLKEVFSEFIKIYGHFDAIHFNNIEGISLDVLDLKKEYPDTRFIFSIHNYVPMCVHGFYYMRHKHCNCNTNHTGKDCMDCTRINMKRNIANATYERGKFNIKPEKCYSSRKWINNFGLDILDCDTNEEHILDFSNSAISKINENCDSILAVSKRVYEIAAQCGFDTSKTEVSYIGTKVARNQLGKRAYPVKDKFKLVFLGNDINYEEKGYPFLLEALSKMPADQAFEIDIVLTVRQKEHAEIYTMLKNFHSVTVYNGYTHAELPEIFEGCNLSIVPVLWEDNLPQIAIESVAYGIPVLASSAGGASELTSSDLFKFEAGNEKDMLDKLIHLVEHPEDLDEFYKHHTGLVTMSQHWNEIKKYYGIEDKDLTIKSVDLRKLLSEYNFMKKYIAVNEQGNPEQKTNYMLNEEVAKLKAENKKLKKTIKEYENEKEKHEMNDGVKLIFQTECDPLIDNVGANLFKIELEDFMFSDFYAEIKFVNIANIDASVSDVLTISGTILTSADDKEKRELRLHQMQWKNGNEKLSKNINVYIKNNEVYFFGLHSGIASGYLYQLITLTSRANHDSAKLVKINEGFLYENEVKPEDAFTAK